MRSPIISPDLGSRRYPLNCVITARQQIFCMRGGPCTAHLATRKWSVPAFLLRSFRGADDAYDVLRFEYVVVGEAHAVSSIDTVEHLLAYFRMDFQR